MSYDVKLKDPVSKKTLVLDFPHHMHGGTYAYGGAREASLNITYNYASHYKVLGEKGIREIYGKTGLESIPMLKNAIATLGNDVDPDYWNPTEGNAKQALIQLLTLAQMRPDGVWDGD